MNNEIKWKNENLFKFKSDITRTIYYKVCSSLDECFLNEHIGGLVGTYLFDAYLMTLHLLKKILKYWRKHSLAN